MRELINSKVKCREAFRPFAPSVLAERAPEFFDLPAPSPFFRCSSRCGLNHRRKACFLP
jgi:carbamoyltransferase